jgi:hypothetical protein
MNASIPEDTRQKRLTASFELARNFPVGELEGIQPTTFGNVIRAFESYPRIMYGFEPVHGWHRLLAVIPKDYRALVDEAKTQTDFWVNIWVVAVLVFVEYIGFAWYKLEIMGASNSPATLAFPLLALVIAFISIWRANMAAVVWGEMVKSAYDVYLPVLYKKMGFSFPSDRHEEREILTRFSQAIIYRSPESMPRRVSPASEKDKGNVRMRGTKG